MWLAVVGLATDRVLTLRKELLMEFRSHVSLQIHGAIRRDCNHPTCALSLSLSLHHHFSLSLSLSLSLFTVEK